LGKVAINDALILLNRALEAELMIEASMASGLEDFFRGDLFPGYRSSAPGHGWREKSYCAMPGLD